MILDVGGYFRFGGEDLLPAKLFLPEEDVAVLDVVDCALPGYVQGTGSRLAFPDGAFDVVMTCDTLEHVKPSERKVFVEELLRVAKEYVLVGAPFYRESTQLAEKLLHEFIIRETGFINMPLTEHIENGLPHLEDVHELLHQKRLDYITLPSGYLYNWLFMMILRHFIISFHDPAQMDLTINKLYNLHSYEQDHREPSYRNLVVVSKKPGKHELLKAVEDHFVSMNKAGWSSNSNLELIRLLLDLIQIRKENQQQEIPDRVQDQSEFTTGNLLHPRIVGQTFLSTRSNLCRIDLMFGAYNRVNTCDLIFRLKVNPQAEEELAVIKFNARYVRDGVWYTLRFPPLANSQNKSYYFSLESSTTDPENALTLWYTPRSDFPYGVRYENGQSVSGCLRFKTYCFSPQGFEREYMRLRDEFNLQLLAFKQEYEQKLQVILGELGGLPVARISP